MSIAVPTFWSLRQTNDDIQVESEASETTVIVTAYQRNADVKSLDARDYLKHFLDTAPVAGRLQTGDSNRQRASARFRDEEGDNWFVRFISNGQTLLLATCHSNRPLTSREGKTGVAVSGLHQVEGAGVSLRHGSIESFFLEGDAGRLEALLNLGAARARNMRAWSAIRIRSLAAPCTTRSSSTP